MIVGDPDTVGERVQALKDAGLEGSDVLDAGLVRPRGARARRADAVDGLPGGGRCMRTPAVLAAPEGMVEALAELAVGSAPTSSPGRSSG